MAILRLPDTTTASEVAEVIRRQGYAAIPWKAVYVKKLLGGAAINVYLDQELPSASIWQRCFTVQALMQCCGHEAP